MPASRPLPPAAAEPRPATPPSPSDGFVETAMAPPAWRRSGERLLSLAAFGVAATTLAGWLGDGCSVCDLFSHFRPLLLQSAVVGVAATLALGMPTARMAFLAALAVNAVALLPYWTPAAGPPESSAMVHEVDRPLSLVTVNVRRRNRDTDRTLAYLRDRRPDVVAVLEVDAAWAAALGQLADEYPHRVVEPRPDNFGIALLSRWPLVGAEVIDFGTHGLPSIEAEVDRPAGRFRIIATHPHPPFTPSLSAELRRHLRAVGTRAADPAAGPLPCVVVGDFNATPWSAPFRDFVAASGLRDTALGRGVQPTWNARLWGARIPIDHIFAPNAATVLERSIGPDVGSDHFPVEAVLVLPDQSAEAAARDGARAARSIPSRLIFL
jgi:endonuclease/exonuclease/phosphatase (EEP) superfamily protein YafD